MNGYHKLSEDELTLIRGKLEEPNINYPHYKPLEVNNLSVYKNIENSLLPGEIFKSKLIVRKNGTKEISVSNLGRVKYKNEILEQYVVGTFLHCTKIYHKDIGDHYIYNLVKETFDPINEREKYQIHHINNNALDNRLENLIWVTEEEHRSIDTEFNKKLIKISREIHKNNYDELLNLFRSINDELLGSEILGNYENVYEVVIKRNINYMCEHGIILKLNNEKSFNTSLYAINHNS
ncbi:MULTISPECIES: HNH endonuclease [unclassified Oceanispirochaeta]|nr:MULTISPECIES: HNH endonuclease [unclassified Oceanispirochaeta]MBF9018481.1 HNH endonuclease [Oceanispirochaeta sp. M2]